MKTLLFLTVCFIFCACSPAENNNQKIKTREIYLFHNNGKVKAILNYIDGKHPVPYDGFYLSEVITEQELPVSLTDLGFTSPELGGKPGDFPGRLMFIPVQKTREVEKLISKCAGDSLLGNMRFCLSHKPEDLSNGKFHVLYAVYKVENRTKTLPGWQIVHAFAGKSKYNSGHVIDIQFTESGQEEFKNMTISNVGKTIAMIYGDKVISAPRVNEPIRGGLTEISGGMDEAEADYLAMMLKSYSLNGEMREYSEDGKLTTIRNYENGEQAGRRKVVK